MAELPLYFCVLGGTARAWFIGVIFSDDFRERFRSRHEKFYS